MSELVEMKKAFYRSVVAEGISSLQDVKKAFPLGMTADPEMVNAWLLKFLRVPKKFDTQPRYVNRFKLGADPEFVFSSPGLGNLHAHSIGLQQGPAFGADNNGRLAEIRPYPSRSALEVVASIYTTLKWLAVMYPDTMQYLWLSGAFLFNDGLGGHVHFGRKRPTRSEEIKALDNINEMMLKLGLYPQKECELRMKGDAHGQIYGKPGDFRFQSHGYEYRTFPSWLDSPELAFLSIAASKLAVYDPKLIHPFQKAGRWVERLMNLFAYYKGVDDDARLGYAMLQRVIPTHQGGDFKPRWGIQGTPGGWAKGPVSNFLFIPMCMKAPAADKAKMFNRLLNGTPLDWVLETPVWPTRPPGGYQLSLKSANTHQAKGFGEMIFDFCVHKNMPIQFIPQRSGTLSISQTLASVLPNDWRARLKGIFERAHGSSDGGFHIFIPAVAREGHTARMVRRVILNGTLPVWSIYDLKADSYEKWKGSFSRPKSEGYAGKVILQEGKPLV